MCRHIYIYIISANIVLHSSSINKIIYYICHVLFAIIFYDDININIHIYVHIHTYMYVHICINWAWLHIKCVNDNNTCVMIDIFENDWCNLFVKNIKV